MARKQDRYARQAKKFTRIQGQDFPGYGSTTRELLTDFKNHPEWDKHIRPLWQEKVDRGLNLGPVERLALLKGILEVPSSVQLQHQE